MFQCVLVLWVMTVIFAIGKTSQNTNIGRAVRSFNRGREIARLTSSRLPLRGDWILRELLLNTQKAREITRVFAIDDNGADVPVLREGWRKLFSLISL